MPLMHLSINACSLNRSCAAVDDDDFDGRLEICDGLLIEVEVELVTASNDGFLDGCNDPAL